MEDMPVLLDPGEWKLFIESVIAKPERKRVIMVGPSLDSKGGISSVLSLYRKSGLFHRDVHFMASYRDGQPIAKALHTLLFFAAYCWRLATWPSVQIVHLHVSQRGSFWRKGILLLLARAFGEKVVFHVHGSTFMVFYFDSPPPMKFLIRFILRRATVILTLSESWQNDIFSLCQHPDIRVLHNPVELKRNPAFERIEENERELVAL